LNVLPFKSVQNGSTDWYSLHGQNQKILNTLIALLGSPPAPPSGGPPASQAARIKEVASVQGVRGNPLVGYGLVVGLDGTGDQTTSAPVHDPEPDRDAAADGA
jgi:hypothetical protein